MSNTSSMSKKYSSDDIYTIIYGDPKPRSVKKDYRFIKKVNSKVCSKCGGKCCKKCGCHFSPDDFEEISFEFLKKEIEKGYISIDYVDGDMILKSFGVYILRVRNQNSPIVDGWPRERNPCILLTEEGCKLDYKHRPAGGRLLIPYKKFHNSLHCYSKYDIDECCYEWTPHQRLLNQLVEYFKDKDIPCSL